MTEKSKKRLIIALITAIIFMLGMKSGVSWTNKGWNRVINSIKVEK